MADDHRLVYEAILEAQKKGIAAALATIIETQGSMPRHTGSKMLVYADGQIVGTVGGGAMEAEVIQTAFTVLETQDSRTETYRLHKLEQGDPGICGGSAKIFIEAIALAPRLVVIGGGHVGKAVAELGKWLGLHVILCDDRADYCNEAYVPGLDAYVVCKPAELVEHISINSSTYIATVTRGLPVDLALFPSLLKTEAAYIGLIGSRRRWALTRKALLEASDLTEAALDRIHAPIGLELNAETPKEIALSILSEIVMIRRQGTGVPMKWTPTEIDQ